MLKLLVSKALEALAWILVTGGFLALIYFMLAFVE